MVPLGHPRLGSLRSYWSPPVLLALSEGPADEDLLLPPGRPARLRLLGRHDGHDVDGGDDDGRVHLTWPGRDPAQLRVDTHERGGPLGALGVLLQRWKLQRL